MPKKRPKQPDLTPEVLKRLRGTPWYPAVDPRTGGVSFWTSLWSDGRKEPFFLARLPPATPVAEINRICEEIGCPPPWTPRAQRRLWRLGWRRRNGFPERSLRPERDRNNRTRLVQLGLIENIADTRPDDAADDTGEETDAGELDRADDALDDLEDEDTGAYERNEHTPSDED
jgi:hypothetical protein